MSGNEGKLISVNVGLPREVAHGGKAFTTGIYKEPVTGPVRVGSLHLDGDGQADLKVHGGPYRAVYAYPFEHYAWWQQELGRKDFGYGQFGENLTVTGMLEDDVCIGDVLQVGNARLQVTQPRSPCFKLAARMGEEDFVARFRAAQRTGFYLRVLQEGTVTAGDAISRIERAEGSMSVREVYSLRYGGNADRETLARAAELAALTPGWKEAFSKMLAG